MRARPIRVTHLIHTLAPGGAERVLVDLAGAASSAGVSLSVVSLMSTTGMAYHRELEEKAGVPVRSLGLTTRWDPRAASRAMHVLRELDTELVHTHLKHADLAGVVAGRRLGLPVVSTLHVVEDAPTPVGRLKRRLAGEARLRGAARTVAVSDALRTWYLDAFDADPARVVTIRNGVLRPEPSPRARPEVRRELGVPDDAVMATMVAVMRPGKGHDDALAAMALMPSDLDLRLVLAGDGELLPRLRARAGRDPRIVFAGFRDDVDHLLAASDLVVHPSRADALPTALIHALANGVPSVATAVGGIPEIVTPDVGVLVSPGDPAATAAAMVALAVDPEARRRLGDAARRRFEAEFEAGAWAARLRALYDEVLDEVHRCG